MENQIAIEVKNVSKIFPTNYKMARLQLKSIVYEAIFGYKNKDILKENQIYALKNINFSVQKNEKIAILGTNGSGKSTLLKMLNGIYMPDAGEININGTLGGILELSSGFKPELTGLDNIYLKLGIQGKVTSELEQTVKEIIEFSEMENQINMPFKNYSSGMKSKLGFAISSAMKPDILILDEVFAAGDKKFREKSGKRIREMCDNMTTILVSHNMQIIKNIANRVIVLKNGQIVFDGATEEGITYYQRQ